MTALLLEYLESLAINHVDYLHDPINNVAYFQFDYVALLSNGKRSQTVLFVDRISGAYDNNKGDYDTDIQMLEFRLIEQIDPLGIHNTAEIFVRNKVRGEEIISKMRHDRENPDDIFGDVDFQDDVCSLLKHVYLENISYEQVILNEDGWSGVLLRMPMKTELGTKYSAEKWL
jgi:hypothetical protein